MNNARKRFFLLHNIQNQRSRVASERVAKLMIDNGNWALRYECNKTGNRITPVGEQVDSFEPTSTAAPVATPDIPKPSDAGKAEGGPEEDADDPIPTVETAAAGDQGAPVASKSEEGASAPPAEKEPAKTLSDNFFKGTSAKAAKELIDGLAASQLDEAMALERDGKKRPSVIAHIVDLQNG